MGKIQGWPEKSGTFGVHRVRNGKKMGTRKDTRRKWEHEGLRPHAETLLKVIFPQGSPQGMFRGDFGTLKHSLTRLRKKSQRNFQGSKIDTSRSF